jgi:hypothetical protein
MKAYMLDLKHDQFSITIKRQYGIRGNAEPEYER